MLLGAIYLGIRRHLHFRYNLLHVGGVSGNNYDTQHYAYRTPAGTCNHPDDHLIGSQGTIIGRNMPPTTLNYGVTKPFNSLILFYFDVILVSNYQWWLTDHVYYIRAAVRPSPCSGDLEASSKKELHRHREAIQHDSLFMDTVHDSWLDWSFGGHWTGPIFINYIWLSQSYVNYIFVFPFIYYPNLNIHSWIIYWMVKWMWILH